MQGQQRQAGHQNIWHLGMYRDIVWHSDTDDTEIKGGMGMCRA